MSGKSGRALRVKVSPTAGGAGVYTLVADINNATMNRDSAQLDITAFGNDDVARVMGLRDCSYELSGFYNSADTNGQGAIDAAQLAGSELWVQFLPGTTTGWKQSVVVSKFSVGAPVNGQITVSISLQGNGPIAAV